MNTKIENEYTRIGRLRNKLIISNFGKKKTENYLKKLNGYIKELNKLRPKLESKIKRIK